MVCFITVQEIYMIVISVVLTLAAMFVILRAYPRQMKSKLLSLLFVFLTALSAVLYPCWGFVIGIVEVLFAFYLGKKALKTITV